MLLRHRELQLPAHEQKGFVRCLDGSYLHFRIAQPAAPWRFDAVESEVWEDGIRPDLVLRRHERPDKPLRVEIRVSHAVDPRKESLVKERDWSMIEIRLDASVADTCNAEAFETQVLSTAARTWIHNTAAEAALRAKRDAAENERGRRDEAWLQSQAQAAAASSPHRPARGISFRASDNLAKRRAQLVIGLERGLLELVRKGLTHIWRCTACGWINTPSSSSLSMCAVCHRIEQREDIDLSLITPQAFLDCLKTDPRLDAWAIEMAKYG